jgi:hypothetical protein
MAWRNLDTDGLLLEALLSEHARTRRADVRSGNTPEDQPAGRRRPPAVAPGGHSPKAIPPRTTNPRSDVS